MKTETEKTDHKVHQWRKFLSNSKDKFLLIKFIAEECREELRSTQEEADKRVFLHGPHAAATGYRAVVITSDDTYAFVLFLTFTGFISCSVFVKRSKQTRTVYMDVSRIVRLLGSELCRSLPGLHAFTGCDSVSAFSGKGTVTTSKLVKQNKSFQTLFQ